ncbi:chromosome segregation protein SMC [Corynebacterium sp. HS2168-gen11]|uniref:chromosome segregation protein SMC n=1 Tax=Corynebacterium sp. HS2168-gen11 TaxID=2974027 RepID=UPI00216AC358|nr:chromosome segregation protein SMC [Corynebacterium sp. HS2168-gen11]MCS4536265.1 chromosome segregation protein SMC [Corynebacterium sp. HS2168-gen11]
MYLKSLTLKGFKSFASATTLKFEPGICAVVGPNGSGKSNVVDALAWVMGEQGAKTLRGGKMEDVIFAGAGDRKPLGRAEVTLTIDNADGALDIAYSEVSVTRRMFRDGASEYEINGTKARLMDIQELLSDSGIGREMHVIVGQGRLAQILEARPEDRRAFIEEAAGVLKHRRRKEKAQRKLANMQVNLDRLTDLTNELQRQLKPLARQAQAAKKAATVQAELRDARLKVAGFELHTLATRLQQAHAATLVSATDHAAAVAQAEQVAAQLAEYEANLATALPAAEKAQQLWFDLSSLVERMSATLRIAKDRQASVSITPYSGPDPEHLEQLAVRAEAEFQALQTEHDIAEHRLEALQEQVEVAAEELQAADAAHLAQVRAVADRREGIVRLVAQQESERSQLRAAEDEVERYDAVINQSYERLVEAEQHLQDVQARAQVLEEQEISIQERFTQAQAESKAAEARLEQLRQQQREGEKEVSRLESRIETLRATMTIPKGSLATALNTTFADIATVIHPDAGIELALATALGHFQHALVGELPTPSNLDHIGADREIVLYPQPAAKPWHVSATLPAQTYWLLDVVRIEPAYQQALSRLLADVVVAKDLATARAVVEEDPRLKAVTVDGEMAGEGWYILGTPGTKTSIETQGAITAATEELQSAQAALDEIIGTFEGARTSADTLRVTAASATAAKNEHQVQLRQVRAEVQRAKQTVAQVSQQHQSVTQQAVMTAQRLEQLRSKLEETSARVALVEDYDDDADTQPVSSQQRDLAQQQLAQVQAMEVEARLQLRSLQSDIQNLSGKAAGLRRQATHELQARQRHDQLMQRRRAQQALAATIAELTENVLERATVALATATQQRDATKQQRVEIQRLLEQTRSQMQQLQHQVATNEQRKHANELQEQEAAVRFEQAQLVASETLKVPAADILRDYEPAADFDQQAAYAEVSAAEKALNRLGKVNPLALEEYKALEERYQFLATQLDDVQQARKDLAGVIEDVDAHILQLFTDAYADVAKEFPKVFATLFPGGEAKLVLTEPDDMLATGIEVEARPPGKRVKRLSLLSGGEKSLTALAMLVAIFRARPSPFYVMDEVEAALDDVNLRRLIALFEQLREESQLIVITHQKPTMDIANVLYGVTMQGDGITKVISQRMNPANAHTEAT